MTVDIEYVIDREVTAPDDVRGTLAVTVDGRSIVRRKGDSEQGETDNEQMIGRYVHGNMIRLVATARELAASNVDTYDPISVDIQDVMYEFRFELLSDDALLVAFRARLPPSPPIPPLAEPDVARGYVVDRCAFCRAVATAGRDYLEDLRSHPVEFYDYVIEDFEQKLTELERAVEGCTGTDRESDDT